jgi:DNA-directed RNA polymerase sigma subunit (sigma70/sigma32)
MEEPQEDKPLDLGVTSYFDPQVVDLLGKLQQLSRKFERAMKLSDADSVAKMPSRLKDYLETLMERERKILCLRLGLENGYRYPLEDVAKSYRITTDRVVQIEARAVRKLLSPIRRRQLDAMVRSKSFEDIDWTYPLD